MRVTNNGLGNNFFPKQSTQMDLACFSDSIFFFLLFIYSCLNFAENVFLRLEYILNTDYFLNYTCKCEYCFAAVRFKY